MRTPTALARGIRFLLLMSFTLTVLIAPAAQAGPIGTAAVVERQAALGELDTLLAREEVRAQLIAWGVDPDEARARAARLSPTELEQLATRMDELPAGGNLIGAAVFVFLVLLVTDILGFTDVFPFVKKTVR
jgi:hypothetical protein